MSVLELLYADKSRNFWVTSASQTSDTDQTMRTMLPIIDPWTRTHHRK